MKVKRTVSIVCYKYILTIKFACLKIFHNRIIGLNKEISNKSEIIFQQLTKTQVFISVQNVFSQKVFNVLKNGTRKQLRKTYLIYLIFDDYF